MFTNHILTYMTAISFIEIIELLYRHTDVLFL